ncbi:MAG: 2-amino-4-hydroxy-6-hydroxymethyldihydropteridine diphosphokinase [Gammaproteobacteria bacterium]|nr:2-amino-4-hydroxy-6-hydroxymethyldihydropteridine diphosphokinase [Gammaproteobacteria bacterium]
MSRSPAAGSRSWQPAYIALGSNLDHPAAQIVAARAELGRLPQTRMVLASRLYASPPMGPQDQPEFVNAVVGLLTQLTPQDLLSALKAIEQRCGRPPDAPRWGPRIIDLDIIAIGRLQIDMPGLSVPHPGAAVRNFVIRPLADIAPALELPGMGCVAGLLARLGDAGLRILPEPQAC